MRLFSQELSETWLPILMGLTGKYKVLPSFLSTLCCFPFGDSPVSLFPPLRSFSNGPTCPLPSNIQVTLPLEKGHRGFPPHKPRILLHFPLLFVDSIYFQLFWRVFQSWPVIAYKFVVLPISFHPQRQYWPRVARRPRGTTEHPVLPLESPLHHPNPTRCIDHERTLF